MIFTSTVPSNVKTAKEIVVYLSERFTYFSRDQWLEKIVEGKVAIEGVVANSASFAIPGAQVTYDAGEFEEPAANLNYTIIYEDEWFLGVDKPGNLLVHRAGRSFRNNLVYQLRTVHQPPFPEAHSTHRLDRDTSGVLLIAKSSDACTVIGNQFASGEMDKEYIAVVKGIPGLREKEISIPIGKDKNSAISYKYKADSEGKCAVTLIEECKPVGNDHALLRLRPLTGRTHQLRIHCLAIGHPIVGDKLYSMDETDYMLWRDDPRNFTGTMDFYRHALHCKSIGFVHPYTKNYCKIEADLPDDLCGLISKLEA